MRRIVALLGGCLLVLAVNPSNAADSAPFFFKNGDRIVFLGDSITEQYQYSNDIELYLTTRFPGWNLTCLNAGISGDTATGGANRFAQHILAEKPTAITINFGMNDGGYGAFDEKRQAGFLKNTEAMLAKAKKAGARVALVSPNAVDRRVQERFKLYLETQKQFYAPLKALAAQEGAAYVDQYGITRTALEKMETADPTAKIVRPFGDGFHTASPGGLFMAHAILTGLNAPALVSNVEIKGTSVQVKGCKVTDLKSTATGVSFDRVDEALPLPVQKDWVSLLPYVNQLRDLNWYGLTVNGLASGKYALTIDGKEVGSFTDKELSEGVNLGNLTAGPIYDQANKVFAAINAKNQVVHGRFRGVVMFNFQAPDWLADLGETVAKRKQTELEKRMEKINALQAEIYKMARPASHRFELKAVK